MLLEYIQAALKNAEYEYLAEDQEYFASVRGLQGPWASGKTVEECRQELASVLEEWVLIKLANREAIPDLPPLL